MSTFIVMSVMQVMSPIQLLAFILLIAGAVCQSAVVDNLEGNIDSSTRAAAGWLLFISIMCLIYEGLFVALRFLNIRLVNTNITIILIVVSYGIQ